MKKITKNNHASCNSRCVAEYLQVRKSVNSVARISKTAKAFIIFLLTVCVYLTSASQTARVYNVNLSGQPDGSYLSPSIIRQGYCCNAQSPDRCVIFNIKLDTGAVAICFKIASGAVPSGSMYYQIGCGLMIPVGQPICLSGPGPYSLSFCKPGNSANTYCIQSYGKANVEHDTYATPSCPAHIWTIGLVDSTITYTAVDSNCTVCNSYLSSSHGCNNVSVQPSANAPNYCDYKVCGKVKVPDCQGIFDYCKTVRIYLHQNISVNINPAVSLIEPGQGEWLYGNVDGGIGPYSYLWTYNDYIGNDSIVGSNMNYYATRAGLYTLTVIDSSINCSGSAISIVDDDEVALLFDSLQVKCADGGLVDISFITYSQTNIVNFTIEKGLSPFDISQLVCVLPAHGANNEVNHYYCSDMVQGGMYYYQVNWKDGNGYIFYSEKKALSCDAELPSNVISVLYCPGQHEIAITFSSKTEERYYISLYSISGSLLKSITGTSSIGTNIITLSTTYTKGIYVLRFTTEYNSISVKVPLF